MWRIGPFLRSIAFRRLEKEKKKGVVIDRGPYSRLKFSIPAGYYLTLNRTLRSVTFFALKKSENYPFIVQKLDLAASICFEWIGGSDRVC
jgi:hypothetical protein